MYRVSSRLNRENDKLFRYFIRILFNYKYGNLLVYIKKKKIKKRSCIILFVFVFILSTLNKYRISVPSFFFTKFNNDNLRTVRVEPISCWKNGKTKHNRRFVIKKKNN